MKKDYYLIKERPRNNTNGRPTYYFKIENPHRPGHFVRRSTGKTNTSTDVKHITTRKKIKRNTVSCISIRIISADEQHQKQGERIMKDLETFILKSEKTAIPDKHIDLSDIPEITDFSKGYLKNWKPIKKHISIRIDADNLEWLKGSNPKGYQQRLNDVIRWARNNGCPLCQN